MSRPTLDELLAMLELKPAAGCWILTYKEVDALAEAIRELQEWRRRAAAYQAARDKYDSASQSSDSWRQIEPERLALAHAEKSLLEHKP